MYKKETLRESLLHRVLLLDGGTGSVLMSGNNDALCLHSPDAVRNLHRRYLEAGADIITTNTFCAQRISQREYHLDDRIADINRAGARLAREEADLMTMRTPNQPRYVLGDVGPTNKMLSMSEDVNTPEARAITFDEMEDNYIEQIRALIEGGVDGILIETIFDTLNAKAAISAFLRVKEELRSNVELLLSMTVSDASGRTLSGQTPSAFITSVLHANPLSVGLNCGMGASGMLPYLREMSAQAPCFVSCHPNAGLPNQFGQYDDTPEIMCQEMQPMLDEQLVNIIGGCCGTIPDHIAAMRNMLDKGNTPRQPKPFDNSTLFLSGLEPFSFSPSDFICIGERCNVAGSRKFLRLINEKKYDEALSIARKQIESGAQAIDINMDDGLLDAKHEMRTFVNLLQSDPSISRVPIMVDSSRFDVIEEGLKCCQGKCIVNSISLKQGEATFLSQARTVRRLGAAVIVMCFDEEGQATDYNRRVAICERAYRLLVDEVGFRPNDIIFDPNVLTVATGMQEHADYAKDFIRATEWIVQNLRGARVSGGLSNLSFAFRGNNYIREAMHSVFLHYATAKGMGMAIMNPAARVEYSTIPTNISRAISDVILNTDTEASERLIEIAQSLAAQSDSQSQKKTSTSAPKPTTDNTTAEERLRQALVAGGSETLESDLTELIQRGDTALQIISGPLMEGMNIVGELFGAGKMFLPQVVKTARTMKQAVDILRPYMLQGNEQQTSRAGRVVIATVKGDVHDIGKNIVAVILTCNNFEVIDLGVMVDKETIIRTAIEVKADIICLSGLITPSLEEMCHVAEAMEAANLSIPVLIGGATTSALHTAVKISPLYSGGVFYVRDAAQNPVLAMKLMDSAQRQTLIEENRKAQQDMRESKTSAPQKHTADTVEAVQETQQPAESATQKAEPAAREAQPPLFIGQRVLRPIPINDVLPYYNWAMFYLPWNVKEGTPQAEELRRDAEELLTELAASPTYDMRAIQAFYPASRAVDAIRVTKSDCPCCTNRLLHRLSYVEISTPRQAWGGRLSLSDYIAADGSDYIGCFAATVSQAFIDRLEDLKRTRGNSDYHSLMLQIVGDRLVEATSEYMHRQTKWAGIRPAIGYSSMPDQRSIFQLAKLIDFPRIGIQLTENGAMYPQASVCGLYIGNPAARYFPVNNQ